MPSKLHLPLLAKVLAAILLGMLCSLFLPIWAVRSFVTFNSIFSNFLGMFIPLLIIGLISPSIADLGRGAGRLLLVTVAIAYFSTVLTGSVAYLTGRLSFPALLGERTGSLQGIESAAGLEPFFTIAMPPFINVTTALVLAFILGLGCTAIPGNTLKHFMEDFKDIIMTVISNVIIPCLPLFIFGIVLKIGADGQMLSVMGLFLKVILVIIALHITVLVCQFLIASGIAGRRLRAEAAPGERPAGANPLRALLTMLPAYATALGTQSSAATIPVTLSCAKKLGVRPEVADFTVPLCATIHMPCSILKITLCCLAVSFCSGMPIDAGTYIGFVMMLAITMVAAPGVPGGAVMAALGVISAMLGFDADMQGIVIAIYIALDGFGTAGNVTGDGAIALIVDHIRKAA